MVDDIAPGLALVLIAVAWFSFFATLVRERARREADRG